MIGCLLLFIRGPFATLGAISVSSRYRTIVKLALPVMGAMATQNLLNLADTLMVGRLGAIPLGAVGMAGVVSFLFMAMALGLSSGTQTMAARRFGAGDLKRMAVPLNAALLLVVLVAPPLIVIERALARPIFGLLTDSQSIAEIGSGYLRYRVLALGFVAANFSFRGYWNGINRAMLYMLTLGMINVVNIALNYCFIFGKFGAPAMGAPGAALASTIATGVGTLMYLGLGFKHARRNGFMVARPSVKTFSSLLRLALPNGAQQTFYAAGVTTMYWIIGLIGNIELAAANVITTVYLVGLLPALGLGMVATSLVGQALGRRDVDDAARWGGQVALVSVGIMGLLAVPVLLFPSFVMRLFIDDAAVIAAGCVAMRFAALVMMIEAVSMVFSHALLGAGDAVRVMLISTVGQWLILLPLAYLIGPTLGLDLTGIWGLQCLYRLLLATLFAILWHRRGWATIEV
jgi:MATE family multidrug resistance protein